MAWSQVNSLFGKRIESSEFAREVLQNSPELTGVYFGYEPHADNQDSAYVDTAAARAIGPAFTPEGRFIPYWFRDHNDNTKLVLEPLVEMETSLYYNGCKTLLKNKQPTPMITEPYVYEAK